jgi:PAS domain S-box-containing protein
MCLSHRTSAERFLLTEGSFASAIIELWHNNRATTVDMQNLPSSTSYSDDDVPARAESLWSETGTSEPHYFRRAFDSAVIGMGVVGLDGQWIEVNPSLCGILGYTERELLSFNFQQMTHPDDLDADLNALQQLLDGDVFSQQMERRYLHKRGHAVWIQLSISLVRDVEDEPQYFIFQVQDISDRKRAADELHRAHEELTARVHELEQRTAELSLVSETSELLQSCRGVEEAYKIIGRSIRQLFPTEAGALCVLNAARDHVEATLTWGEGVCTDSYFTPDDCWALRRNRMHVVLDAEDDLPCPHVQGNTSGYMCLPLTAQRETLGLLYVQTPPDQTLAPWTGISGWCDGARG